MIKIQKSHEDICGFLLRHQEAETAGDTHTHKSGTHITSLGEVDTSEVSLETLGLRFFKYSI